MLGYYDRVIELAARRPAGQIDAPILDVLRLGVHQLLSMRVAQHAAVDEAVSQAREVGSRSATGFVNGVLRTITRSSPDTWRSLVLGAATNDDERLAAEYSHPVWIIRAFRRALAAEGREDELESLLEADNAAPHVSLAALPGLSAVAELAGTQPGRFSPFAAVSDGGDPAHWPAVRDGRARVQDEGSQLAALALSRARPIRPGERWLDLCAGPGGKAALLAAEAVAGGATLVANELVPARAELVRKALAVFDTPPEVWELDGTTVGSAHPQQFDRILLDAPCTGLGRPAPSPGGALAQATPRRRRARGAADQAAGVGTGGAETRRHPRLRDLLAAPGRDEGRGAERAARLRWRDGWRRARLDTPAVLAQVTREKLELPPARPRAALAAPARHRRDVHPAAAPSSAR